MKKFAIAICITVLLNTSNGAYASEMPPASDVSCGFSNLDLVCTTSIQITGSWTVSGSTYTDWYIWKLKKGTNPGLVSNYENKTLFKNYPYSSGSTNFTYEYLLNFVGNEPNGVVLIGATLTSITGGNTLSNESGKKTYIELVEFKAALDKAKADAEAKAKADAEAKAKADAEAKAKADATSNSQAGVLASILKSETENIYMRLGSLEKISMKFKEPIANFRKVQSLTTSRLSILQNLVSKNAITKEDLAVQIQSLKDLIGGQINNVDSRHTIKCAKGKSVISVKAVKPKCPAGFRVTR